MKDGSNNLRNKIKIDSKFRTLGSNTIIFAIGNVFSKLILFFLMPLYTSAMSPTEYGFAELMNNGIDLLMPLATLCLYEAVFRFSIDVSLIKKKEILSSSLKIILIINTLVLSISILVLFLLDSLYPILFSFMLFAYSIRQLFAQFSRGIGKARFFAMSGILNAIILGISNVVLVGLLSYGVNGYLFSIALGNVSSAFYLYFRANIKQFIDLKILDKTLIKELLTFSIPMIPNSISWWFANISTRYILVMFQGIAVAGIFTAISKLPSIINVLSSIFQQAWQFSASKEISNKQASNFFTKVFLTYYSLIIASCSLI
ncbi:lipopolysaccharide biosynthesis protein, partial [Enterococcus sp. 3C7_DIV0644]